MKSLSRVRLFAIPWTVAYMPLRSWDFPGKDTGVGCHFLLQGIFLTQELNPGLLHCRQMLSHLSPQGTCTDETCPNRVCTLVHCSSEMLPEISVLVWAAVTKITRLNALNKKYIFLSFKDGSLRSKC